MRYWLECEVAPARRVVAFVGVNPSRVNASVHDHSYAAAIWHHAAACMTVGR
ncbi:DUF1643 domain-containing protein [Burkholderia semiarida]|nr:DUF1643 domain-containing protein [Burkholderia semiarida]